MRRMERVTTATFRELKARGEPIVMVSAYDYLTAKFSDEAGVDSILVGDSLAGNVLGYANTLPVTMEEMLHHTRAVARGARRALVVGDMPFMSYQASVEEAVRNAGRFVKEAGAQAVKVEGGSGVHDKIEAIVKAGIPVMGHLGLTPQWIYQLGGYKVQGRTASAARQLVREARLLEELGVFSLVLECVPWRVAKRITRSLQIPVIGCGAGPYCDGQVLVLHDLIGLTEKTPKFVKRYAEVGQVIKESLRRYRDEVKKREFPTLAHSYGTKRKKRTQQV